MTTSDYLKIQADLLIAINQLRRLELESFTAAIAAAAVTGGVLLDTRGLPVQSDLAYMLHVAEAAEQFRQAVASYQPTVRKAMQVSETLSNSAERGAAQSDAA